MFVNFLRTKRGTTVKAIISKFIVDETTLEVFINFGVHMVLIKKSQNKIRIK